MLGINGYERGYRDIAGLILGIESEGRQHAFVRTKKAKPPDPVAFASGQGRPVHARAYIRWVLAHQNRHERMDLAYRTNDTHPFPKATHQPPPPPPSFHNLPPNLSPFPDPFCS